MMPKGVQEVKNVKVTIRDIAKAANVSPATVSNSFSGNNRVSKETRLRVLEIARQMGYQEPCQVPLNKRILLAVFHKNSHSYFNESHFSEIRSGVEAACRKNLYNLNVIHLLPGDTAALDSLLQEQRNPVLLLASEMSPDDMRPFLQLRAPLLVLDSHFMTIHFSTFHIDNLKAGYIAGDYLITRGHRRIGMITSALPNSNVFERQQGLSIALGERGLHLAPEYIFPLSPSREGARKDMLLRLDMWKGPLPTALFAYNDLTAAGAMDALQEKGIRVPEDISIMGMDNMPLAEECTPALTSVHVSKYSMGYQAVEQLLLQITHSSGPILKTAVDVSIAERQSVADLR